MHFLLLSSTYFPEKKSASFMLKELAQSFVSRGHKVTVLTFSHNLISEVDSDEIDGVTVIRLKVTDPKFSKIKRALVELSYSWKLIQFIKKDQLNKVDALIYFSPSIFFGRAVSYIKKFYSIKSFLIIRDLFPDWLVKIKQLKKGPIYYFFKFFEFTNFKSADFIGTESVADIEHVINIVGKKNHEVEQLRNWFAKPKSKNIVRKDNNYISNSKINLVYGGSLGLAQDVLGFLKILEKETSSKFLKINIIGEGEQKLSLKKFSKNSDLDIQIISMMERDEYFDLVHKSDAGLVILDKNLVANNYPGKSFDYMFSKKPLVCFFHESNEFGKIIEKENLGYFIKSNHRDSLHNELNSLVYDEKQRIEKGENSYNYLQEYFSVERASHQIQNKFFIEQK